MGKPIGLGPRLVAIQQAGITKEEAGKQIQAQAAAGVPPEQMVLTNPQTAVVVPLNIPAAQSQSIQETAPGKRGIDLTSLALGWNKLMDDLRLPSALKIALDSKGKAVLGQTYKTNQYDGLGRGKHPGRGAYESAVHSQRPDGTIGDLEKGR